MLKPFLANTRAATVPEFATFVSLTFTLCLVLYIGFNDLGRGIYRDGLRDLDLLTDTITENCLVRTRANDTIVPRQAKPYNCFKLAEGDDRITIDAGDNVIYPGNGRNVIVVKAGSGTTQVVNEDGEDIIHFGGGAGVLDLRQYRRDEVTFGILEKSPATTLPGTVFDPTNRPASDLLLRTPRNIIIVADNFNNKPVSLVVLKDARLDADDVTLAAIAGQADDRNNQILGTNMLDIVSPGAGNDGVRLFEGDDVITYSSGHDRYDPGPGRDILEIPHVKQSDASFSVGKNGDDVKIEMSATNSIVLADQLIYPPSGPRVQFAAIKFSDAVLREGDIVVRAVSDQGTQGDDEINGTRYSDAIHPGAGINIINPGFGSDTIYHEGGTDTINNVPADTAGFDTLDISAYARSEITFSRNGQDLVITTPTGSSVIVKDQFSHAGGEKGGNIELFRLKGENLKDEIMRQLFFSAEAAPGR